MLYEVITGVHGILVQTDAEGVASGRLLDQSPSAGCPMTLRLEEPYTGWPRRVRTTASRGTIRAFV